MNISCPLCPMHMRAANFTFCLMAVLTSLPWVQVVKVISGALKALGNHNAGISKVLIELYVAMLASGEVTIVLSSGVCAHIIKFSIH